MNAVTSASCLPISKGRSKRPEYPPPPIPGDFAVCFICESRLPTTPIVTGGTGPFQYRWGDPPGDTSGLGLQITNSTDPENGGLYLPYQFPALGSIPMDGYIRTIRVVDTFDNSYVDQAVRIFDPPERFKNVVYGYAAEIGQIPPPGVSPCDMNILTIPRLNVNVHGGNFAANDVTGDTLTNALIPEANYLYYTAGGNLHKSVKEINATFSFWCRLCQYSGGGLLFSMGIGITTADFSNGLFALQLSSPTANPDNDPYPENNELKYYDVGIRSVHQSNGSVYVDRGTMLLQDDIRKLYHRKWNHVVIRVSQTTPPGNIAPLVFGANTYNGQIGNSDTVFDVFINGKKFNFAFSDAFGFCADAGNNIVTFGGFMSKYPPNATAYDSLGIATGDPISHLGNPVERFSSNTQAIAQCATYNRLLTDPEVLQLWNNGTPVSNADVLALNPIALWATLPDPTNTANPVNNPFNTPGTNFPFPITDLTGNNHVSEVYSQSPQHVEQFQYEPTPPPPTVF